MADVIESKVYVGNLPFSMGFAELKELFSSCGEVTDSIVIVNKYTGRSKGFGFVTFAEKDSAQKAISEMNGKDIKGRRINVRPAMPIEEKKDRNDRRSNKRQEEDEEPEEDEDEFEDE